MELAAAKLYLRVDTTDEDDLITNLISAAINYIEDQTAKTYVTDDPVWDLAINILVAHWFEKRELETTGSVSKVGHSFDALLNHIALCGVYS